MFKVLTWSRKIVCCVYSIDGGESMWGIYVESGRDGEDPRLSVFLSLK